MNAELLMLLGGVTAFGVTVYWVRGRELSERHALGWLFVATLLLVCGLFPHLITTLAETLHLSYPAVVLFIALSVIYLFAFSVSVALTPPPSKVRPLASDRCPSGMPNSGVGSRTSAEPPH